MNRKAAEAWLNHAFSVTLLSIVLVFLGTLVVRAAQLAVTLLDTLVSAVGLPLHVGILTAGITPVDLDFGTAVLAAAILYAAVRLAKKEKH